MTDMRADYDSKANAISLHLGPSGSAERADQVHPRVIVAVRDGRPIELQLLYPELRIDEPLRAVADRYTLDTESLIAAARAAVSTPDRAVTFRSAVS